MPARPTFPLRLLLAAILILLALGALLTLTYATDAALSILERLERLPTWLAVGVGLLAAIVIGACGWLLWTLFRPARTRKPRARPVDRPSVQARVTALDAEAPERASLQDELATVENEIGILIQEMERSIAEADVFIQQMTEPTGPATRY